MEMTNNTIEYGALPTRPVFSYPEAMDTFDALPPAIRRRLAEASVNFSPTDAANLLEQARAWCDKNFVPRQAAIPGVLAVIAEAERAEFEPSQRSNLG